MLRNGLHAVLSLVAGLVVGALWSKYDQPKLGNFQTPEGVAEYRTAGDERPSRGGSESGPPNSGGRTKVGRSDDRSTSTIPDFVKRLYRTVGDDGRLTWGARELASLDDASAARVQVLLDEAFAQFAMQSKRNLKKISDETLSDGVGAVYEMKSFAPEGASIWETLQGQLKETVGNNASAFLITAFNPDEQMGFLGRYDYKFTILPATVASEVPRLQIEAFDPKTGKLTDQGVSKITDLRYWMRGLLDPEAPSGNQ